VNATGGVVAPDERLPRWQILVAGVQHAIVMFGATGLRPLLMGFDKNAANFFSGVGTLIFFAFVGGRAMSLIAAVVVVLVAENLGDIKSTAAMTGRDLHRFSRPRLSR